MFIDRCQLMCKQRGRQQRWKGRTDKIAWEQLIKRDLPPLVPDGETAAGRVWFEQMYGLMYRGYSTRGVHASAQSVALHLSRHGDSVGVEPRRYSPDDGTGHLIFAGTLLGNLAINVYAVFGLDAGRPKRVLQVIGWDLTEADLTVDGDWSGLDWTVPCVAGSTANACSENC